MRHGHGSEQLRALRRDERRHLRGHRRADLRADLRPVLRAVARADGDELPRLPRRARRGLGRLPGSRGPDGVLPALRVRPPRRGRPLRGRRRVRDVEQPGQLRGRRGPLRGGHLLRRGRGADAVPDAQDLPGVPRRPGPGERRLPGARAHDGVLPGLQPRVPGDGGPLRGRRRVRHVERRGQLPRPRTPRTRRRSRSGPSSAPARR